MRVVELVLSRLRIPLRASFRHALAERRTGDSVLVTARDEDGRVGHGECAPRPYVTGETPESVLVALRERWGPRVLGETFDGLEELRARLVELGDRVPRDELAAFCALETALLDLGGRCSGRSAGDVLGPPRRDEVVYSGVVSADDPERVAAICARLAEHGVEEIKAKVGRSLEEDRALLGAVRETLGDGPSLRVDANCAWDGRTALERLAAFAPFRIDAVEQPCPAEALGESALVRRESEVRVVLDESLASLDDARRAIEAEACDVFNLRVSKCGGLLLSERLRGIATDAGLRCMLGAQVGESAILSAAGRLLATRGEELLHHEGSFGTLLLEADASDDTALGPGGVGKRLEGPGLGAELDLSRLAAFLSEESRLVEER